LPSGAQLVEDARRPVERVDAPFGESYDLVAGVLGVLAPFQVAEALQRVDVLGRRLDELGEQRAFDPMPLT
jgi:hypothetical protein